MALTACNLCSWRAWQLTDHSPNADFFIILRSQGPKSWGQTSRNSGSISYWFGGGREQRRKQCISLLWKNDVPPTTKWKKCCFSHCSPYLFNIYAHHVYPHWAESSVLARKLPVIKPGYIGYLFSSTFRNVSVTVLWTQFLNRSLYICIVSWEAFLSLFRE